MRIHIQVLSLLFGTLLAAKNIVTYYTPWGSLQPEDIPFDDITHLNYGFGLLIDRKAVSRISLEEGYDTNKIHLIRNLIQKNKKKTKFLISLGGWTGSQTFSLLAKDKTTRGQFINNTIDLLREPDSDQDTKRFGFDGVDIDWEFPIAGGPKCNENDPQDTINYEILLEELRIEMDKVFPKPNSKLLTAAVKVTPFLKDEKTPSTDMSAFANLFDFINVMTYDIMGSFSKTTGANAPFEADIANGGDPFSFVQGIKSWLDAGFPEDKINAGLAFYGRSQTALVDMTLDPKKIYVKKSAVTPKGDSSDTESVSKICKESDTPAYSGFAKYSNLRNETITGSSYDQDVYGDFHRFWDEKTQTPWLFNKRSKQFVSYDDPKSIGIKVDHVMKLNLGGVMYWDVSMDYKNELLYKIVSTFKSYDATPRSVHPPAKPNNGPKCNRGYSK